MKRNAAEVHKETVALLFTFFFMFVAPLLFFEARYKSKLQRKLRAKHTS